MNRRLVQIYLSDKEYDKLKALADKSNMTISDYIRSCTIDSNSGVPYYLNLATDKINKVPSGMSFTFATLMADEWDSIPKNLRSTLGKQFFKKISCNDIPNVEVRAKNSSKAQLYKKIR